MSRLGRVGVRRHGLHVVGRSSQVSPRWQRCRCSAASRARTRRRPASSSRRRPVPPSASRSRCTWPSGTPATSPATRRPCSSDSAAAHLAGTRQLHDPIAASGRGVVPLGPLTVGRPHQLRPVLLPGERTAPPAPDAGTPPASPAASRSDPSRSFPTAPASSSCASPGRVVVDSHGRTIAARPSVVVRIQVGASHRLLRAPAAAGTHAPHAVAAPRPRRPRRRPRRLERRRAGGRLRLDDAALRRRRLLGPPRRRQRRRLRRRPDVQTVAAAYTAPRPAPPRRHRAVAPVRRRRSIAGLGARRRAQPGARRHHLHGELDGRRRRREHRRRHLRAPRPASARCAPRSSPRTRTRGRDGIAFNIPGTGVQTIALASALPDLSDSSGGTEIDGYTQPGSSPNTDPAREQRGAADRHHGRRRRGRVRGAPHHLPEQRRSAACRSTAPGARSGSPARTPTTTSIAGNFIGTDPAATYASPSFVDTADAGILVDDAAARQPDRRGDPGRAQRHLRQPAQRRAPLRRGHDATTSSATTSSACRPTAPAGSANVIHGLDVDQGTTEQHHRRHRHAAAQRPVGQRRRRHRGRAPHRRPSATRSSATTSAPTSPATRAPAYARNNDHGVHVDDGAQNTVVTDNVVGNAGTPRRHHRRGPADRRHRDRAQPRRHLARRHRHPERRRRHRRRAPRRAHDHRPRQHRHEPGRRRRRSGPRPTSTATRITQNSIYGNSGLGIDVLPGGRQPERLLPGERPEPGSPVPGARNRIDDAPSPAARAPAAPSRSSPPTAARTPSARAITFVGSAVATAAGTFTRHRQPASPRRLRDRDGDRRQRQHAPSSRSTAR